MRDKLAVVTSRADAIESAVRILGRISRRVLEGEKKCRMCGSKAVDVNIFVTATNWKMVKWQGLAAQTTN